MPNFPDEDPSELDENTSENEGRRALLKALASGAGYVAVRIALPAAWSTPMIASLLLPSHAQASVTTPTGTVNGASSGTPTQTGLSCAPDTPVGSTQDDSATIVATVDGTTISLVITPPSALLTAPKPMSLCESSGAGNAVASMALPSKDSTLSGQVKQSLTRPAGTYKFQLRWENGNSAWVTAVVQ